MSIERPRSLKWSLIKRLVALHAVTATMLVLAVMGTLWTMGYLVDEPDAGTVDTLAAALARDAQGQLALRETSELAALQTDVAGLWFVIRDRQGQHLSRGTVPPELARIDDVLSFVDWARLGWHPGQSRAAIRMDRVDTSVGEVQILAGYGAGRLPLRKFIVSLASLFSGVILPYLVLTTLITLAAASMVVRRSLAGVGDIADQAARIDFERRGKRLPAQSIPLEVSPLVNAVNDALARLDEGYERHERFLADAAHELRTPIAIVQTRAESLAEGPEKRRLLEDIARLATLAEQLLDLQRLNQRTAVLTRVDLVALGRRVAADMAPLAIAAGYEVDFEPEVPRLDAHCDQAALERALTNLLQNAIEHGGRRGTITVTVGKHGTIEVADEGAGVPKAHRERIFEPFYRVQPGTRGAGLGLHLVREIVRYHDGQLTVHEGPSGGARFKIALPLAHSTQDRAMLA
jgi:signal transduction histidine kinase